MTESWLKAMLLDTSKEAEADAPHPSTVALPPSRMLSAKSSALSITLRSAQHNVQQGAQGGEHYMSILV